MNQFGPRQAEHYVATVLQGLRALRDGPNTLGTRSLDHVVPDLRFFRLPRVRHVVIFHANLPARRIDVLRILHASMDPLLHLPPSP